MSLRQFLYYDESLVDDFLAQLEGGQSGEVKRRRQLQRDRKGEASIGTGPLRASGGRGRNETEETEAVIRQGRASNFERMHELLEEANELTTIEENLDEDMWSAIKRGDLLEIDALITVSQVARLFSDPGAFAQLASLAKAVSPESIDSEAEKITEIIEMLAKLGVGEGGTLTAVGNPPRSPYKFIMHLDKKFLVPGADIDGESTVLLKMARKLKENDKEPVIDLPGMATIGMDLRRSMIDGDDTGTLAVQGPGAIVVPLAIFR